MFYNRPLKSCERDNGDLISRMRSEIVPLQRQSHLQDMLKQHPHLRSDLMEAVTQYVIEPKRTPCIELYAGPASSGKTTAIVAALHQLTEQERISGVYYLNREKELEVLDYLKEVIDELKSPLVILIDENDPWFIARPNDWRGKLRQLKQFACAKPKKLRVVVVLSTPKAFAEALTTNELTKVTESCYFH